MNTIHPPATLGVLGAGQLGRMFVQAAQALGYRVATLDPDPDAPAHQIADLPIVAAYDDLDALSRMADACAAVTVEFESIPVSTIRILAGRCVLAPAADAVAIAQDRLREKRFLRAIGLPVAPFVEVLESGDLFGAGCYPGILKLARNGYDGKGQRAVQDSRDALEAWQAFGRAPCVLEKRIALDHELSVILARGAGGELRTFPVAENRHRNGILELSVTPARVPAPLVARAAAQAAQIAEYLDYVGVLGVEFFVSSGTLLVNEFAPRPHNSGHFTIDACITSQFEQQVRAVCGLPLGETRLLQPAAMINVLGDAWRRGPPDFTSVHGLPGASLHLYGKRDARPGRKMGHVTFVAQSADGAAELAERALRQLVRHGASRRPPARSSAPGRRTPLHTQPERATAAHR